MKKLKGSFLSKLRLESNKRKYLFIWRFVGDVWEGRWVQKQQTGVQQGFKKCFCRLDALYFDVGRNVAGWSTDR